MLKNAKIIEEGKISNKEVTLGSQVTLLDVEADYEQTYIIVIQQEEDIFKNKISAESPVGAAILGKEVGAEVRVKTPSGPLLYKVLKIDRPQ